MRQKQGVFSLFLLSPSSRRAWIEIAMLLLVCPVCPVALLAEGVDRNTGCCRGELTKGRSPSSRRAWIEMQTRRVKTSRKPVALLAEGVDRNDWKRLV